MGLSCRALETYPTFPTYPEPLSTAQQGAGLVAPAAAVALLGKSGAVAMLIATYMAVCPILLYFSLTFIDYDGEQLRSPPHAALSLSP